MPVPNVYSGSHAFAIPCQFRPSHIQVPSGQLQKAWVMLHTPCEDSSVRVFENVNRAQRDISNVQHIGKHIPNSADNLGSSFSQC